MYALVLLALLGASPPDHSERWIPFPANPTWELYGKEDSAGVFRYTQTRRKPTTQPVLNLGVNLPPLTAGSPHETVMGTDPDAAKLILSKPAAASKLCAHSDCPDGRCDRRKPRPPPAGPDVDFTFPQIRPIHIGLIVAGLIGSVVVVSAFVLFLFICVRVSFYFFPGKAES